MDVENLIEEVDRICGARNSLGRIGRELTDFDKAERVRTEVEWFVQHAAERVTPSDAKLMWGSVLRTTKAHDITFVTTNYDRAIELAANSEGISLEDGFGPIGDDEKMDWCGFNHNEATAKLVKLHGSTDWFAEMSGDPIKTRHPMALFGRATLKLEGQELGSALVLPSREKLLTRAPYPRLSQAFLNASDECEIAVFVGSSLRDDHIRNTAQTLTQRVPVFIVNTNGNNQGVEDAYVITNHASTFLMSTLPNALLAANPVENLKDMSETITNREAGILSTVKEVFDANLDVRRRCNALERLHSQKVTLSINLVRKVLNDSDATLARYALGLIPYSTSHNELIEIARRSRHYENAAFQDELSILGHVVSSEK